MDQNNLFKNMVEFDNKSRPRTNESDYGLYEGRELTLNAFKSGIFPINKNKEKNVLLTQLRD